MSRPLPSICAIINSSFEEKWVVEILKQAAKLGAVYFNGTEKIAFANYNKAARVGMNPDLDSNEMQFLIMCVEKMEAYVYFEATKNNNLLIRFVPAGNHWEKDDNNSFIDLPRYVRFLLDMINDFYILGLRVVDESYEDIFDDVLY